MSHTSQTRKLVIDLACTDIGLCFIAEHPTGVTYTNQTGGYCCHHPELEGFCVPLRPELRDWSKRDPLQDHVELDKESAEQRIARVEAWLSHYGFEEAFSARGDAEVEEAWIPVQVKDGLNQFNPFADLGGMKGVITYVNSD